MKWMDISDIQGGRIEQAKVEALRRIAEQLEALLLYKNRIEQAKVEALRRIAEQLE